MKRPYKRLQKDTGFESHTFMGSVNQYGLQTGRCYNCHIALLSPGGTVKLTLLDSTDMVIIHYGTVQEFNTEWRKLRATGHSKKEIQS